MSTSEHYFDWPVYGLSDADKRALLTDELVRLTRHHADNCEPYRRILQAHGQAGTRQTALEQVPFLPVRLFKERELSSVAAADVFKVLTPVQKGALDKTMDKLLASVIDE